MDSSALDILRTKSIISTVSVERTLSIYLQIVNYGHKHLDLWIEFDKTWYLKSFESNKVQISPTLIISFVFLHLQTKIGIFHLILQIY